MIGSRLTMHPEGTSGGRVHSPEGPASDPPGSARAAVVASEAPQVEVSVWGSPLIRRSLLVVVFAVVLIACRWLAFQLRFDFDVPFEHEIQLEQHWWWVVGLQLGMLALFGQLTGVYRYFSVPDMQRLAYAIGVS